MPTRYTQDNRPLAISTPLGANALLLETFQGTETISEPFRFDLQFLYESKQPLAFDKLLGQKVSVRLGPKDDKPRWFHGILARLTEGRTLRGVEADTTFIRYRAEMVPQFWLLRHRTQSRIFQQISVPDILKQVLTGFPVSYQIQGTFRTRDYCVQYRESDFAFASRLMEEEGIYYYFKHTESMHQLVVANTPEGHADFRTSDTKALFEESERRGKTIERIFAWEKTQELRAVKYTLRDHHFERPDDTLQAVKPSLESVSAGKEQHKLKLGANESLERYDYPGGYAGRFDGVNSGGGDRASDLSNLSTDADRTVALRIKEEAAATLVIAGSGDYRDFSAGRKFTLSQHPTSDGAYVLTSVAHSASVEGSYTSHEEKPMGYSNHFRCLPTGLPFAPPRATPRPHIDGLQTAVVVGPQGEEIFTDKYGRVKVQFFWDREGKKDSNSSCWIRVASSWAGQQWGAIHIPRIGQEVVIAFEEGDPDQPIIVGSVYNAAQMPPFSLPQEKTRSGLRTRSSLKGTADNCNELRFEDKKDSEDIFFHAEKDFHREVEHDDDLKVGNNQTIEVKKDRTETVTEGNEKVTIKKGKREIIVETGDDSHTVKQGNRVVVVETGDDTKTVKTGDRDVTVETGDDSLTVKTGNREVEVSTGNDTLTIKVGNQTTKLSLGASSTEAMQSIQLKVGANSIKVDQTGVTIQGLTVKLQGQVMLDLKAAIANVGADGILTLKGGITMIG